MAMSEQELRLAIKMLDKKLDRDTSQVIDEVSMEKYGKKANELIPYLRAVAYKKIDEWAKRKDQLEKQLAEILRNKKK